MPTLYDDVMTIIQDLDALIVEENKALRQRDVAALETWQKRKITLTRAMEAGTKELFADPTLLQGEGGSALRTPLVEAIQSLNKNLMENGVLLRASRETSEIRIQAIMDAYRQQRQQEARYGADGRLTDSAERSAHVVSLSKAV